MNFTKIIGVSALQMSQAEEAAKSFHKAMKGIGTDEARVIKEILAHSNGQRQIIKQQYKTMYGHTLEEDLKSEIGGNFLKGVLALLEPTDEYEAHCVKRAIKGIGTDEQVLIQTLCPKEAHEIEILKAAYQRLYGKSLDKDIADEQNGPLGRIFRSIVQGERPENRTPDFTQAKKDAQDLYDAGQGKVGTDEIEFVRVLCSRSFPQLRATFEEYYKICNTDFEKAVKKELSGDLERACLAIVKCARNKPGYFAEQLHEAMKGAGTKDDDLIRLLVCRAEADLQQIKEEYKRLYGKNLYDVVKSELSGDYEKLFLGLLGK